MDWKKMMSDELFEYLDRCKLGPTQFQRKVIKKFLDKRMDQHGDQAKALGVTEGRELERAKLLAIAEKVKSRYDFFLSPSEQLEFWASVGQSLMEEIAPPEKEPEYLKEMRARIKELSGLTPPQEEQQ